MIRNLKNILMNKKKKSAFTLIELIIVIAIIAILAAVALPKFGEVRENANRKSDISNAKTIQSAVVALINDDKIDTGFSFDIPKGTKGVAITATTPTTDKPTAAAGTVSYMQTEPKFKAKNTKGKAILVDISTTGDVKVYFDKIDVANEIYPEQGANFTK